MYLNLFCIDTRLCFQCFPTHLPCFAIAENCGIFARSLGKQFCTTRWQQNAYINASRLLKWTSMHSLCYFCPATSEGASCVKLRLFSSCTGHQLQLRHLYNCRQCNGTMSNLKPLHSNKSYHFVAECCGFSFMYWRAGNNQLLGKFN